MPTNCLINAAKKAKSPADIADALKDDLSACSVSELQAFSRELFAKGDRGRPALNVGFFGVFLL